jgi:asparagine synthase (glutamine-hydrolysing)
LGIDLEVVTIRSSEWRAALVGAVQHHEYPMLVQGSVLIGKMSEAARRRGVKVLLTGEAADELFGGYVAIHLAEYRAFLSRTAMLHRRRQLVRTHGAGQAIRGAARRLLSGFRPSTPSPAIGSESRQRFDAAVRASAARAYEHHPGPRGELEAALLADLTAGTFPYLLNRMDKDAMGHSIETRLPFLDAKVVPVALNLPLEARIQPEPKGVLRDVGRRILPAAITERPKQGGLLVGARRIEEAARPEFLEHGMLRDLVRSPTSPWHEFVSHLPDRRRTQLWTGEIWCRLFLAGQSVPSVEHDLWATARM